MIFAESEISEKAKRLNKYVFILCFYVFILCFIGDFLRYWYTALAQVKFTI